MQLIKKIFNKIEIKIILIFWIFLWLSVGVTPSNIDYKLLSLNNILNTKFTALRMKYRVNYAKELLGDEKNQHFKTTPLDGTGHGCDPCRCCAAYICGRRP
jgi:hypothetical protein